MCSDGIVVSHGSCHATSAMLLPAFSVVARIAPAKERTPARSCRHTTGILILTLLSEGAMVIASQRFPQALRALS
jgi:hypothetical protein